MLLCSVFGHLGEDPQPSSEHFRNKLGMQWHDLDSKRFVFLEDEEAIIGKVHLPQKVYRSMRNASVVVHLDVPFELRTERLLDVYGRHGPELLSEAVSRFRGGANGISTDTLLQHLSRGELRPVCEASLRNYDKTYSYHMTRKRTAETIRALAVDTLDSAAVAEDVLKLVRPLETSVAASSPLDSNAVTLTKTEAIERNASCYCGFHEVTVSGDPEGVSICHCSTCRRLSGAPFMANALFGNADVTLAATGGDTIDVIRTDTSSRVKRFRCARCYCPLLAEMGNRRIVPLALFDFSGSSSGQPETARPPKEWRPRHHLHYDSRVLDISDDLPKYRGRVGGELWKK
eukprot:TRINITY_DN36472_c0_g2_i1.p1 TRINITY_DN36472_c0_g2~~TRINITY_DN36472_c0_g2_i1.p1  ORF type:complete len:345 (-),score=39.50 TRINITY_DN36472_c0_g2_i1:641-1675(-)